MTHRKANTETESAEVTRSFRVPLEDVNAVKRIAERNHRTFSGELRALIEAHLVANGEREAA